MLDDMDGSKTDAMVSCCELLKRLRLIGICDIVYFGGAIRLWIDATTSWCFNAAGSWGWAENSHTYFQKVELCLRGLSQMAYGVAGGRGGKRTVGYSVIQSLSLAASFLQWALSELCLFPLKA